MDDEPDHWTVDVSTSDHDDVKRGIIVTRWSRVHLSREEFPDPLDAEAFAALLACSIHGGMPTHATHAL